MPIKTCNDSFVRHLLDLLVLDELKDQQISISLSLIRRHSCHFISAIPWLGFKFYFSISVVLRWTLCSMKRYLFTKQMHLKSYFLAFVCKSPFIFLCVCTLVILTSFIIFSMRKQLSTSSFNLSIVLFLITARLSTLNFRVTVYGYFLLNRVLSWKGRWSIKHRLSWKNLRCFMMYSMYNLVLMD